MKRANVVLLILLIGFLGIIIVWINNIVYIKAKYIDELKDERDIWYVKYMDAIRLYYQRSWGYEDENFSHSISSDSLVSDSSSKAISNPSIR